MEKLTGHRHLKSLIQILSLNRDPGCTNEETVGGRVRHNKRQALNSDASGNCLQLSKLSASSSHDAQLLMCF